MFALNALQKCLGDNLAWAVFTFTPNGASQPVATLNRSSRGSGVASGFSVVRTSAGLWTLTLAEPFPELVGMFPSIVDGVGAVVNLEADTPPGAMANGGRDLAVRNKDAAGAALDIAAAAGRQISVLCFFRAKTL